ncbi:MAG TPA: hypothetical protein VE623_25280 [Acidimicrobiales bacterium]|jgi:hypothetical protein|nr:hypothetical protein [Acidimicrobiales bacterium]
MPHTYYPAGNPKFNHVALSVPSDLLDEANRADLCRYFDEVLGFEEMPTMTIDRKRLILSCVHWDQFIFLVANDEPMRCPRTDHYGFAVGSREDLLAARDRAVAFRERDPRVDLDDYAVDDQGVVKIHSIYVRYLLPMTCELQWWEFPGGPPAG